MRSSFRLRLAVLAAVLTGLVLGGFGVEAWWLIRAAKLETIDAKLRALAERIAARGGPERAWPADPVVLLGGSSLEIPGALHVLVVSPNGDVLSRSADWPQALEARSLPWPAAGPRGLLVAAAAGGAEARAPGSAAPGDAPAHEDDAPGPRDKPLPDTARAQKAPGEDAIRPPLGDREPPPAGERPVLRHFDPDFPGSAPPGSPGPAGEPPGGPPGGPPRGPHEGRPDARRGANEFEPGAPHEPHPWGAPRPFEPMARHDAPHALATQSTAPTNATPLNATPLNATPLTAAPQSAASQQLGPQSLASDNGAPAATDPSDTPARAGPTLALVPPPPRAPGPPPVTRLLERAQADTTWRVALAATTTCRVAIAFDEAAVSAEMRVIRNALLLAVPAALVLIALGAWFMATRALRPLRQLTSTIRRVSAEGLDRRVAAGKEDREFAELIEVFNAMLERLERGFTQASRFSADAAHELRTPLTILQGELERLIQNAADGEPLQVALAGILDEVRRLSMISRKLLLLSRADAGRLRLDRQPLDLSARLGLLLEDTRLVAPELRVTGEIAAGLTADVDAGLIDQLLQNLISNAIKYNIPDGWIHITAARSSREIFVSISNPSEGLGADEVERVFERFYRADRAHGRGIDGVGLGLALAREIARAHGGDLAFQIGADARVFLQLTLPRHSDPSDLALTAWGRPAAGAWAEPTAVSPASRIAPAGQALVAPPQKP